MNSSYLGSIYDKRKNRYLNNAAKAMFGNRIAYDSKNAGINDQVNKYDKEHETYPNQVAFDTIDPGSMRAREEKQSVIYREEIGGKMDQPDISLNRNNILNGIIFSEILGKPRCKRRGP